MRLHLEAEFVGRRRGRGKERNGGPLEANANLRGSQRKLLTSTNKERHTSPPPIIEPQSSRHVRLHVRSRADALFGRVATVLASDDIASFQRSNRAKERDLRTRNRRCVIGD